MQKNTTEILVQRLSYLGLGTYVLLALLIWLVPASLHPFIAIALTGLAATHATFLGGIHAGIGLHMDSPSPRKNIALASVPALLSWIAIIMPAYAGLPLLGLLLAVWCFVDHKTWPEAGLSSWLPLRLRTTVVAVLCCLLGAAGT
jgi:hypothetical protein